jgi:cytochrome P450/ferredoxin-NADP reductase
MTATPEVQPAPPVPPESFDHHSDLANADPIAYYARFRNECPVGKTDAHGGFTYTTRYADIVRIARDDATFSSAREYAAGEGTVIVIPRGAGLEQFPIELDPPRATDYRDLINPLLTPTAVDQLLPMIARHTTRVIDAFIANGSCDFVDDLTNPLPAAVTLDWLGFPESDWEPLAGPIHDIFAAVAGSERAIRGGMGLGHMDQRIRELIRLRQAEPAEDAVSVLVGSRRPDGSEFSEDELVSVIGLLIAGGVDTTTSLTGSTLIHLARHPDQRQRLIDSPDLLETATEEFLRAFAPSQSMARTLTRDAEISGCPVHTGDRVLIPWVAANHDPAVFPDPEQVRLDRDASRHLSFGIGSHRCAGAHLARAMFREMMTQILTRLPDYQIGEAGLEAYPTSGNQAGWDHIPATFTPGVVLGSTSRSGSAQEWSSRAAVSLTIAEIDGVAGEVVAVSLVHPDGEELPAWRPGAHLEVRLPSGRIRQYSLCGDPAETTRYRIAVLREPAGRGGSTELHELAQAGATLTVHGIRNRFPLLDAQEYLLIAGGIGVTPILAMARELAGSKARFRVVYGGRSRTSMAFTEELEELAGAALTLLPEDESGRPDLTALLAEAPAGTAIYCCGPPPMIAAAEAAAASLGLENQLHVERFAAGDDLELAFDAADNTAFDVVLARSGTTLHVPADRRLIEVLREAVPGLTYDCEKGYCGACETRVLAGTPEHRDSLLTETERAEGGSMMICVGRCRTDRLVLDL